MDRAQAQESDSILRFISLSLSFLIKQGLIKPLGKVVQRVKLGWAQAHALPRIDLY